MAIDATAGVSSAPVIRVPITGPAIQSDELRESPATREKETESGNEAAVPVRPSPNPNVGQNVNTSA